MKEKGMIGVIIISVFLLCINVSIIYSDDVDTNLTVIYNNVAPILVSNIPNQTWAMNSNLTNAFDLDDYFIDNETLTYTASSVPNVNVVIDPITNIVSFYPDDDFSGVRSVTFTADDGFVTTDSNLVTLNIINDSVPPWWSNPTKDLETIYQNSIVSFSADWEDDIDLGSYIFSINELGTWVNQSATSFSGITGTSSHSKQISAPGGSMVYWRFYGFDSSGNMNETAIYSFTVSSTPGAGGGDDSGGGGSGSSGSSGKGTQLVRPTITQGFKIDGPEAFKFDIIQGSTGVIAVKIINTGTRELSFGVSVRDLEMFGISINLKNFTLASGGTESISIEFEADRKLSPDLYFGALSVKTPIGGQEIPIVIGVKPFESEFELNVSIVDEFKDVKPGEIVKANITIMNLKQIEERNFSLYYSIVDFKGNVIDSGFEEFTFLSRSKLLNKELTVSESSVKGEYIFFARAVSGEDVIIDSDIFKVGELFNIFSFIKANLFFLLLILIALLVAFMSYIHHRNVERLRLLNLYLRISEMKSLMKKGEMDKAISIYVRIKSSYGEPVSKTALENKEKLKLEMAKLSEEVNEKALKKIIPVQEGKTGDKQITKEKETVKGENKTEKKEENSKEEKGEEEKEEVEGQKSDKQVVKTPVEEVSKPKNVSKPVTKVVEEKEALVKNVVSKPLNQDIVKQDIKDNKIVKTQGKVIKKEIAKPAELKPKQESVIKKIDSKRSNAKEMKIENKKEKTNLKKPVKNVIMQKKRKQIKESSFQKKLKKPSKKNDTKK